MKCPIDKENMIKGSLIPGGPRVTVEWIPDDRSGLETYFPKTKSVNAFMCQKCGKVELTTEVK